jgi:hypothetical protein
MIEIEKIIDIEKTLQVSLSALQEIIQDNMVEPRISGFTEYLDRIGAGPSSWYAIESLVHHYEGTYADIVNDIFVSNDVPSDETALGTLWFFSENNCVELTNYMYENKTHPSPLKHNVRTFSAERKNYERMGFSSVKELYDPTSTLPSARFHLIVELLSGDELQFKASGRNCDFLLNIFNKYIKANQEKMS